MYLYVTGIDLAAFYDFDIWFRNSSDNVLFCSFFILLRKSDNLWHILIISNIAFLMIFIQDTIIETKKVTCQFANIMGKAQNHI